MKFAWIEDGRVRDIAPGNPAEFYTPNIAALYDTQVPDGTENGATLIDGVWTNPTPQEPPAPAPKPRLMALSPPAFLLQFTSQERIAIRAARASDPVIDDWMQIVDDPRLTAVDLSLQATKDGLSYLVGIGILTADRRATILLGIEQ